MVSSTINPLTTLSSLASSFSTAGATSSAINNTSTIGTTTTSNSGPTASTVSTTLTNITSTVSSVVSELISTTSTAVTSADIVTDGSLNMVGKRFCEILSNVYGGNVSFSFHKNNFTLRSCRYNSGADQSNCIQNNVSFNDNTSIIISSINSLAGIVANCTNASQSSSPEEDVSYASSCGGFGDHGRTELVLGMVTACSIFFSLCILKRCLKATKERITTMLSNISHHHDDYNDSIEEELDIMHYRDNQDEEEEHIYEEIGVATNVNLGEEGGIEPVNVFQHGVLS
ncbi:hypothetical protein K6025_05185 [Ehrlichia sp. JZT12]